MGGKLLQLLLFIFYILSGNKSLIPSHKLLNESKNSLYFFRLVQYEVMAMSSCGLWAVTTLIIHPMRTAQVAGIIGIHLVEIYLTIQ